MCITLTFIITIFISTITWNSFCTQVPKTVKWTNCSDVLAPSGIWKHTHTIIWRPFVRDYPGLLSTSDGCYFLDQIKPAYNQNRLDGRLKLKASGSAFNWLWISMLAVLVVVPTVRHNSLQPLSASSISAYHLLDFMVQGEITEAGALTIHLDATPSALSVPPPPSSPHFTPNVLSATTLPIILAWERHQITLAWLRWEQ